MMSEDADTLTRDALLREYGILDTDRETAFDDLVALAARIMDTPIATVSLLASDREWFKAEVGLGAREAALETAFCIHACDCAERVMIVPDATLDSRFAANPLVTGEPRLRASAGAILRSPEGVVLGALCAVDRRPREFTREQLDVLEALARQVMAQLELRRAVNARRLQEEQARKASVLHLALLQLSDRLRDMEDVAEMSFVAAEVIATTLGVSRAGYGLIDPMRETIDIARDWNAPGVATIAGTLHFRDYGSYIDDLKRGELVVCTDARLDPRTADTAPTLEAICARSFINMPVTEHGGFVALLFVNHAEPRDWSEEDIAFLREVADRTRTATERRRAEADLRELAASLERRVQETTRERDQIWQASSDMLSVADFNGYFTSLNPAWAQALGWSEAEMTRTPSLEFVHEDDRASTVTAAAGLAAGAPLMSFENRYRCKDGAYRWLSWNAVPRDGRIYAVVRDVTEAKELDRRNVQLEEQLRQSQKMEAVGQLTGGIAHDFNNLLAGISGSLELLQARISQGRLGEVDRYITAAQGAAKRAAALTHRLLAFSRRQTLDPKATNVNRLIAGMEDLIRRAVAPSVDVEVVGAAGLWSTLVDPNQLENALLNLCINARDAMPSGGRITIETANKWLDARAARERDLPAGQFVSLCVTDTGVGMTPEVIARAFDPFFTTKPLGQGTGLGLSMIYGFVRQSSGQVRIYSEVGQGTTMCIYLPRHMAEAAGDEVAPTPPPPVTGGRERTVLVVDDEPTVRMLVADILGDLGYSTLEAEDGPSAMRLLGSDLRVDLLVTDVGLPGGMNGRQVADAGRIFRPDLKVLFITGYAENAAVGNGHLDAGMQVLTKPFAMEALASKVRDMADGPG